MPLKKSIINYEFLSCIPGTLGGTIRMNSGCFMVTSISDILISVKALDFYGNLHNFQKR